ncbi:sigma-70 family RNA polymerase sigma factor [Bacillus cereus]|uniref:sigma-70 family RNA polymerase sigma factor n=1 Tax=Bacillus TaxID=1386 RepID=UPI000A3BCBCB|nr:MULTISPECIES: sigma-70 family RNA polymerase sigma factor [Bacillus]MEB8736515.1 sigma-70 family RNA polymerase sigma factor [Bacillus cereus]MDM5036157.1 sigma-70 family RNA polymerase sigma factor [Bacillus sp. OR-18]MEB8905342.1 sigma-70 family RNA polymerase sigma factor [Bacillus cereus]MEB9922983.1 sigma-70 family RNA polymerase sigma factor [Bacillus cereus]MEB9986155.1 sigma-70 family RNA polymerase sigma factor [Bacillus cereus]
MERLIYEYNQTLCCIRECKADANKEYSKVLSDMESDLVFAIEWMQTGRRPGNRRGIERRAAYQRERTVNPLLIQRYFRSIDADIYEWDDHAQEHALGEWEKIKLEDVLSVLTEREKEVYLMSRGYCLTYSEIACYLVVSRSTVQTLIERAEKKIARQVKESIFCNN